MIKLLMLIQIGMKDKDGCTAFMHALRNKQIKASVLLRKHEAASWTPLMRAAFAGDIEAARKHIADKDKRNSSGETALMLSAKEGHGDIVELLDPIDDSGVTALMRAVERDDVEAARLLIPLQAGWRTTKVIWMNKLLISKGTALMRAAACGHTEMVRLLAEHEGCMQDADGRTALMWATYWKEPECVRVLAEREGAIKSVRRYQRFPPAITAFDIAKSCNHDEIIAILSD